MTQPAGGWNSSSRGFCHIKMMFFSQVSLYFVLLGEMKKILQHRFPPFNSCTSLLTECFIDCCQPNLIDCDLMRYISWAASLRRRAEGQPFPLREQRAHPKWKGMVRNISIYWEWCCSLANGSSQLVFTVGADWAPSSLIALCVLTVCWGDSRQKVELRNTMRTHAMIGLSWTAVGALLSL